MSKKQASKRWRDIYYFGGNREKVLERDNYTCQKCGSKYAISVHHKDGKGRGYTGVVDNSISNLITLCNSCHQVTHTEYFKPKYLLLVAKYWDLSNREIGKLIGCSHTTVLEIRKLLARKLETDPAHFTAMPK